MRAYFFGNMYLSSIQQGIQAAHVITNIFTKYDPGVDKEADILYEWALEHETMVLLNAGYSENIRDLLSFFDDPENPYPWSEFHEGEDALDCALTDVGIILPEKIYEGAKELRANPCAPTTLIEEGKLHLFTGTTGAHTEEYTKWEAYLMNKLNTFGLAK